MSYPQQPENPYGQQSPAQPFPTMPQPVLSPYAMPTPPKAKSGALRLILAVVITAAVCGISGIAIGSAGKSSTKTVAGPTVTTTVTQGAAGAAPIAAKTTAAAKPTTAKPTSKTIMTFKGNGIKNSPKFKTGDDWVIDYTYDCSSFGSKGNFQVMYYTDGELDNIAVNELAKKGSDSAPVYGDSGTHYLSINSECSWTVKVVAA